MRFTAATRKPPSANYYQTVTSFSIVKEQEAASGVTVSTLIGYEAGLKDAADQMRSACVEKVRNMHANVNGTIRKEDVIEELESVSIEQQEAKQ